MNGIRIKRAEAKDAQIVAYLGKKTFTETFADLFSADELSAYLDKTFNTEKLLSGLSKEENIFGILFYLDAPVGYYKIKLGQHFDHSADNHSVQLQKIYLLQDYLHLKLGKQMLNHIQNLKEIQDYKMIWLLVLHSNGRAIRFYEREGFEKLKTSFHTIGSQVLEYDLMIKSISYK